MGKGIEAFGPAALALPWRGPRSARARLDAVHRTRLEAFDATLNGAWSTPDPIDAFGRAFLEVWRGSHFAVFPGAVGGPPRWTIADALPRFRGAFEAIHAKMSLFRAYGDRARDPFANRPASCHGIAVGFGRDRMEGVVEELLVPIGYLHQLRSVLYDRKGRVTLFAGVYRTKRQRPFDLADHALLHAMQPSLRRWRDLAEALGTAPIGERDLSAQVEKISLPCFVAEGDRVLFANARARTLPGFGTEAKTWRALGSIVPLRSGRVPLDLVVIPEALAPSRDVRVVPELPPYLRDVAEALASGASDKEIASSLDVPLTTVRTYVARILARSGVHSRRAWMRLV